MFNNGWRKPSDVMSNYLDRIGAGWVLANPEVFNFDYVGYWRIPKCSTSIMSQKNWSAEKISKTS